MGSAVASGLEGLLLGITNLGPGHVIMLAIACVLLYLGIKKGYEPLLLVPIGFGAIWVNIPLSGMMAEDGFLRFFYDFGVLTEIFPLLIFFGIGAMTDFQPLLENPKIILLGAAGQFGTPHWTVVGTARYSGERFGAAVDLRWFEGGAINNQLIEGEISSVIPASCVAAHAARCVSSSSARARRPAYPARVGSRAHAGLPSASTRPSHCSSVATDTASQRSSPAAR